MPKCKKCSLDFPVTVIIGGKRKNLCSRKYCLSCSPFGLHNTRNLHDIEKSRTYNSDSILRCKRCDREYLYQRSKGHTLDRCNTCVTMVRKEKIKKALVEYKGGCCQECGYRRCITVLQFHHLDPSLKEFSLSRAYNRSWDSLIREVDKCILLCSNCHGEEEYRIIRKNKKYLDDSYNGNTLGLHP